MIRFFGMILGFVLMVNIAVSFYQSDYSISALPTMAGQLVRVLGETIKNFDENGNQDTPLATVPDAQDVVAALTETQEVPEEIVVEEIEQPAEVRVFWGPFRHKNAARGFAAMAENITGMDTDVIEQVQGRLYVVAFVGQPEAINQALATFTSQTGMVIKENSKHEYIQKIL